MGHVGRYMRLGSKGEGEVTKETLQRGRKVGVDFIVGG